MATTERRLSTRHPINVEATIITPSSSIPARTVDICAGGIRVQSPAPVLPDTDIALSLNTREETLLSGFVLWAIEVAQNEGPPAFEMGIEAEAFILSEHQAIGHAERETLVQEILSRVREKQD